MSPALLKGSGSRQIVPFRKGGWRCQWQRCHVRVREELYLFKCMRYAYITYRRVFVVFVVFEREGLRWETPLRWEASKHPPATHPANQGPLHRRNNVNMMNKPRRARDLKADGTKGNTPSQMPAQIARHSMMEHVQRAPACSKGN
eukprot:1155839-Pelagomonas_calceolata.AAC.7